MNTDIKKSELFKVNTQTCNTKYTTKEENKDIENIRNITQAIGDSLLELLKENTKYEYEKPYITKDISEDMFVKTYCTECVTLNLKSLKDSDGPEITISICICKNPLIYIDHVYIPDELIGKGIGTKLIKILVDNIKLSGYFYKAIMISDRSDTIENTKISVWEKIFSKFNEVEFIIF